MFIYNPETIIKVSEVSHHDHIEYLLIKKRFAEAMDFLNKQIKNMPKQSHFLLYKTQNGQMFNLLKTKQLDSLRDAMIKYLKKEKDKDRWTHWINRLV
jgi:hypothetical protein